MRVLLLVLACVAFADAVSSALVLSMASDARRSIERDAEASARAVAGSLDLELSAARSLLSALTAANTFGNGNVAEFRARMADLPKLPLSSILLFDDQARLVADMPAPNGVTAMEVSAPAARMAAALAARQDDRTLSRVRLISSTGGVTAIVAAPLAREHRDGRTGSGYAVALVLRLDRLAELAAQPNSAESWLTAVVDSSGKGVAQGRGAENIEKIEPADLVPRINEGEASGGFSAEMPGHGEMYVAYSRSAGSGWTAIVAVPESVVGRPLRRALFVNLAGGGIAFVFVAGLALLGGSRIVRPYLDRITDGEERFRVMTDTVPAILFTAGPDGRCDYVNQRFYDYTRMPNGSALGFGWTEAVDPEDRERVLKSLEEPTSEDGNILHELRLRAGDGSYRWFLGRLRPMRGPDGRVIRWFGSSVDIDNVKKSEAALRAANAQLAAVLAGIDECCCTIDRQSRLISVNHSAAAWFGRAPADLIGRTLSDVMSGLAESELAARLGSLIEKRAPFHMERQSSRTPGSWIEIHGYPWADGLSIFFRDITRRKAAEDALRRARALLQGTIDALSAQIVVIDGRGVIIAANAAWRHLGEDNPAGASGRIGSHYLAASRAMVAPQDFIALARGMRAVIRGDLREFRMLCGRRGQGGEERLQIRATRFDGDTSSIVVAHEDVTEIARAETELRELAGRLLRIQDEERRRIARDLHDSTAQNLVAATMTLDRLRQRPDESFPEAIEGLDEVRGLIDRSVREIRTLSYLLHPPLLEELGLASALRWFIHGFEKRSGVTIGFNVRERAGRLPAEVENALFRIVQEALTNVHRHSGSATAQVRLFSSAREAVLIVADRGNGMVDTPASGKGGNWGSLGVGISGMRVRLHQLGGALEIRSSSSGTRIRARVPLRARGEPSAPQMGDALRPNGQGRSAPVNLNVNHARGAWLRA